MQKWRARRNSPKRRRPRRSRPSCWRRASSRAAKRASTPASAAATACAAASDAASSAARLAARAAADASSAARAAASFSCLVFSVDLVRAVVKGAGFEAIHGRNQILTNQILTNIVYLVCTSRVNLGHRHAQESDKLSPPCALPGSALAGTGDLARVETLGCTNLIAASPTPAKSRARTASDRHPASQRSSGSVWQRR